MATWLNKLVLPPVVMAVCALGMLVARWLADEQWQVRFANLSGSALLLVIAAAIMFSASRSFLRAGTTLHPQKLQQVSALIVSGSFRFSRNPIYLGQMLLLAAWALALGGWGVWLWWLLYFAYLDGVQIPREEKFLQARFGEDYTSFCRRVRRWL
ncbi:methyltransferase family protein [Serratia aquatilis]|uniref:Methyltransferase family protein n=1 Tax=Serratia aquatilis TaxID=1737515 RepID=A0ABV6EKB2_9GAMM